ncbi:MAG: hypothetical protein IPJ34_18515 [Myxococcales bacterium]|nr:hypothetical protein [Myxococcales bacterium]
MSKLPLFILAALGAGCSSSEEPIERQSAALGELSCATTATVDTNIVVQTESDYHAAPPSYGQASCQGQWVISLEYPPTDDWFRLRAKSKVPNTARICADTSLQVGVYTATGRVPQWTLQQVIVRSGVWGVHGCEFLGDEDASFGYALGTQGTKLAASVRYRGAPWPFQMSIF